jgi:hypothetical protein
MNFIDLAKEFERDYFQPVAYPTAAIQPLMVITNYQKGAIPIGNLQDFMVNIHEEVPKTQTEKSLDALEGKTMKDLKAGVKADPGSILNKILKFGADYSRVATLQYRFADIQHSYILPRPITKFLCASEPDPSPDSLSYVRNEDEVYIVSDVLQSGVFGIIALDQNGSKIDIQASVSDAEIGFSAESKKAMEGYTVYNNPEHPHSFAIRAIPFWAVKDEETGKNSWKFRRIITRAVGGLMIDYPNVKPREMIAVTDSQIRIK